jgi:hypothetical protein
VAHSLIPEAEDHKKAGEAELGNPTKHNLTPSTQHPPLSPPAPMPPQTDDKRQAAREIIDILHEISILLVRTPVFLSRLMEWNGGKAEYSN